MKNVSRRSRNPFDLDPPCDQFVPGFGDPNADFHVIGEYPGKHGGAETGIPFTGTSVGETLLDALTEVGLVVDPAGEPLLSNCYLSYLYLCVTDDPPSPQDYAEMERFFDAELRAITAHVLLPVGEQAIRYVLENYSQVPAPKTDAEALHASEISNGAWIIVPIADPERWTSGQRMALVDALEALLARDYRRESDLGRFIPGGDPYLVR